MHCRGPTHTYMELGWDVDAGLSVDHRSTGRHTVVRGHDLALTQMGDSIVTYLQQCRQRGISTEELHRRALWCAEM